MSDQTTTKTADVSRVDSQTPCYAPGPGWKYMGSAVWEHTTKARVHVGGLIRLPDMSFVSLNKWPEGRDGWKYIKICGGNRKRGLMTWAVNLVGA